MIGGVSTSRMLVVFADGDVLLRERPAGLSSAPATAHYR